VIDQGQMTSASIVAALIAAMICMHAPAATERAERSPVYYAGRLTIMQRLVRFSDHLTAGNAAADTPSVHISAAFE
jgi:hypothetical protein